jgi:hypothetical protein
MAFTLRQFSLTKDFSLPFINTLGVYSLVFGIEAEIFTGIPTTGHQSRLRIEEQLAFYREKQTFSR